MLALIVDGVDLAGYTPAQIHLIRRPVKVSFVEKYSH